MGHKLIVNVEAFDSFWDEHGQKLWRSSRCKGNIPRKYLASGVEGCLGNQDFTMCSGQIKRYPTCRGNDESRVTWNADSATRAIEPRRTTQAWVGYEDIGRVSQ